MEIVKSKYDTFEVVDSVPARYTIWNIGANMPEGYLPMCEMVGTDNFSVRTDTLKAIKLPEAQTILAAIGGGQNTVEKMEAYIKRYKNAKKGTWAHHQVERMKKALPILREAKIWG